jgi:hypothetical protein
MFRLPLAAAIISMAVGASAQSLPPTNLRCSDFLQRPDGSWYALKTTFDIGSGKKVTLTDRVITKTGKSAFDIGGVSLYEALAAKCGKRLLR